MDNGTVGYLGVTKSLCGRQWRQSAGDERLALALAQRLGLPELIGRILAARGVAIEAAPGFLSPRLRELLPDPSLFKDMDRAAERLARAITHDEVIAIFGDYDVDGATSSALLQRFIEAARGREAGLDVIVVDHHVAEPSLPRAFAVVNPNRLDEAGGHGQLAAVGVAFLLAVAVNRTLRAAGWYRERSEPDLMQSLDLVALGTICDVVPLTGVNRALVAQGLKVMQRRGNAGIAALADIAGITESLGAYHAGFIVGPRVNAGGRVGSAGLGARLLATADAALANDLARQLHAFNAERREIESGVLAAAVIQVEQRNAPSPIVFATGVDWHPGVIGIVASRLKERYNRPSCVIAIKDGVGKGSGRSVSGVALGAAIIAARQEGLLVNGGGHAMAAGFTVEESKIGALREFLAARIEAAIGAETPVAQLTIDGAIAPLGATGELLALIEQLAPFGSGNPEPRFAIPAARILFAEPVGGAHVRCTIADAAGAGRLKAIAFRCLDNPLGAALLDRTGALLHFAGHLRADSWNGKIGVQFMIDDAAPVGAL